MHLGPDDRVLAAIAASWPVLGGDEPPTRAALAERFASAPTPWRIAAPRPGERYEDSIADGRIPTRDGSWHDAFNARAFAELPRAKAALHARMRELPRERDGRRTREADALTLLDETALVLTGSAAAIEALGLARESGDLTEIDRVVQAHDIAVCCLGHALFEHRRLRRPPIGAGVVALVVPAPGLAAIDNAIAAAIAAGRFREPCFAPTLPWPHAMVDGWLLRSL
jgi:hypothetical protein